MNYVDVIIICLTLISIYIGYNGGFYKILSDTIVFFVVSILSSLLTGLIFNGVINYLPFFNYWGASEGIKSINIVVWRVLIYFAIMILLLFIIDQIFKATGLQEKIDDKIITMKRSGRYLGCLLVIPFMMVLIYNMILFFGLPIFNIKSVHESKTADILMNNMIILSSQNKSLYESEKYIIDEINNNNTVNTYRYINDNIVKILINSDLINKKNVD